MLSERHRAVLYQRLTDTVGDEEAVGAMLSHFPATDLDRPATKADLVGIDARFSTIDARFDAMEARFDSRMHAMENRIIIWMVSFVMVWSGVLLAAVRFTT